MAMKSHLLFWPDFGGKQQELRDIPDMGICKIPGHADTSENEDQSHTRNLDADQSLPWRS